jgi:hypothetical protein
VNGNKEAMKLAYRVVVLLWVCLVVACSPRTELAKYGNLAARIQNYYSLEKQGDWEHAYDFRTPAFRKTNPIQGYVSQMKKDSAGWHLERFYVVGVKEIDDKVHVSIHFKETAPISIVPPEARAELPNPKATSILTDRIEDSVWVRIGNEWFVYDAAPRSHLWLNEAFD